MTAYAQNDAYFNGVTVWLQMELICKLPQLQRMQLDGDVFISPAWRSGS